MGEVFGHGYLCQHQQAQDYNIQYVFRNWRLCCVGDVIMCRKAITVEEID